MERTAEQRIADVQAQAPDVATHERLAEVSRWSSLAVGARLAAKGGPVGLLTFGAALGGGHAGAGLADLLHTPDGLARVLDSAGMHRIGRGGSHPATIGHQVAHSYAFAGFLAAAAIGIAATVAVGAVVLSGGTALTVIGAAAAGGFVTGFFGGTISGALAQMGARTGPIATGSPNVFIKFMPAARMTDNASCSKESGPVPLIEGCATILVNGLPMARIGHKLMCGAVVDQGEGSITIDESSVACADPEPEVPVWARVAADWLGFVPLGRFSAIFASRGLLNKRFGPPRKPFSEQYKDGIKPFEKIDGKPRLNETLQTNKGGNKVTLDPNKEYIWVIDKDGNLSIGEEVPVGEFPDGRKQKLGHPTLTGGQKGRIGGELRWDKSTGTWTVNGRSGRYTVNYNRTQAQLEEAAQVMKGAGVDVGAIDPLK